MKFPIFLFAAATVFLPGKIFSQKKVLTQADVHRWRKIEQPQLSADGRWSSYVLMPNTEGDPVLCLWNAATEQTTTFPRGTEAKFTDDANYLIFKIKQPLDSLKAMRRRKVKDEDLPKDSMGVFSLADGRLTKFPNVKNFAVPEKWSGWMAYQLEAAKPEKTKKDSLANAPKDSLKVEKKDGKIAAKKPKKEGKDNGNKLIIRNLTTEKEDTAHYVLNYVFSEKGQKLLFSSSGRDSSFLPGVYLFEASKNAARPLFRGKGKFQNLAFDKEGAQAVFLADLDTTKARIRPWQLGFWAEKMDSASLIAGPESQFLPKNKPENPSNQQNWQLSENHQPRFSDDGSKLFFGIAPPPILPDTNLLPEEIVSVEVWSWTDDYLHTMQKSRLEQERKRSFPMVYRIRERKFVQIGSEQLPETAFSPTRNAETALAWTEKPYAQELIWDGAAHKDLYSIDLKTGDKTLIVKNLRGDARLSPAGKFAYWFSEPDSAWFAWNLKTEKTTRLTDNRQVKFFNEESDTPDFPAAYGFAGWLEGDEAFLVYDKFDIWKIDPTAKAKPERLTKGREENYVCRYLRLDPEEKFISPGAEMLLHEFDDSTKNEGYAWLDLSKNKVHFMRRGTFAFSKNPIKARRTKDFIFTYENFNTFPDLVFQPVLPDEKFSGGDFFKKFGSDIQISDANPQQREYAWGDIQLVKWTSLDGQKLSGLLVTPPDFDPRKKYPMLVNFYERSSDDLRQHRAPDAHRSQINYAIFASQGYLIFNPDIPYKTGYPGESALNAILPGVTALIEKGFVDEKRIGIQGHSWGGYQTAYLLTKTNLFACAEAGAPVVNMVSAYGGIRWESGRSRIFQYEHQQSRIGGSLWQYPLRFLENSPIFSADKVQTPVLILHNDKDGAVPWYQGIEYFTALVRLGKPAWLLNYNDEPHWPVKLQNRLDFQLRMQQFFDHFLKDAPRPLWMNRGVPALEKGILQGLELEKE